MTYNFTFNTADVVELRKQVLRFYGGIVGKKIPNVIDEKEPWLDVVNDFQLVMYIYLMKHANYQVELVARMNYPTMIVRDKTGKEIQVYRELVRGESKQILKYYRNDYKRISAYFPMNNVTFVSQYADVDEAMEDSMQRITDQIYYPLLNNMLKMTKDCNGLVAQATARMITAVCFMVMAVQTGMQNTHKVPSKQFENIVDRLCRLTCYIVGCNHVDICMDDKTLEENCKNTQNVVQNITKPMMEAIQDHAKSINLYHYVKAADYTLSQFEEMKTKVQRATNRVIVGQQIK